MKNKKKEIDDNFHSANSEETILSLLDAYMTHELEQEEHKRVEYHLEACSECQHLLIEVTRLRRLLTTLAPKSNQHEVSKDVVQEQNNLQLPLLATTVLAEIEARKKGQRMEHRRTVEAQQNYLSNKAFFRERAWSRKIAIFAAVLCVMLLTGIIATIVHFLPNSGGEASQPAPIVWQVQHGQTFAQSSGNKFALKYIEVTGQEFRFFYAFTASHPGPLQVEAISYLNPNPQNTIHLVTIVQPLGSLGAFSVGVIRVSRVTRVGQIIALQITLPAEKFPTWELSPLRQLIKEPNAARSLYGLSIDQNELPAVTWYGPVTAQQVAFFKDTTAGRSASHASHVFLNLANAHMILIITQAQYLAIAGPSNFF